MYSFSKAVLARYPTSKLIHREHEELNIIHASFLCDLYALGGEKPAYVLATA